MGSDFRGMDTLMKLITLTRMKSKGNIKIVS